MLEIVRKRSIAGVAMGIAVSISLGLCQKPTNPPGGGGGTGGGGTPGSRGAGVGQTTVPQSYPDLQNRGVYLSGTVTMEDGTPPPEPVTIERVCALSQRAQAYTDSQGHFSFLLGQTDGILQDASEQSATASGGRYSQDTLNGSAGASTRQTDTFGTNADLSNCELRAVLAGYRSEAVRLTGRRYFDNPDVGTIILHRLGNVEGSVISVISLQAPKDAKKAHDKARDAVKKGKLPEAEKELRKAVEIYPRYATAWFELGRIQQHYQNNEQARQSYANALAADPKFTSPYLQLAGLALEAHHWSELADITGRLLRLDAVDYPVAYLYQAAANFNLGKIDAAEKSARTGQRLDTLHQHPNLDRVLAMILARKKDYAGAAEQMRSYLQYAPVTEDLAVMKKELAQLEALAGTNQRATAAAPKTEPAVSPTQPPR